MKCESFRNRLLALPSPAAPTPELVAHLATCSGCRAFASRAGKLDALIAAIPVPSSETTKQAFLESLGAFGPVIQTRPVAPSLDPRSGTFRPLRTLARKVGGMDRRFAVGLAAALLVAVSAWLFWPAGKPTLAEKEGPRQELLAKQNKHLAALAKADSPDSRLRVWADWAADLRTATADVVMAADPEDFAALERMYEKAVRDGVVRQAEQLPRLLPPAERQAVLREARSKLGDARVELERLLRDGPPTHQAKLKRMATQTRDAIEALTKLSEGV